ncbi:hypothetical protein ACSUZJ_01700 [Telluria sp. B2]
MGESWPSSRKLLRGTNYCPWEFPEGYAKAKLRNSKIKLSVQNFAQIQHKISAFSTKIIQLESFSGCIYIAVVESTAIKKPPHGAVRKRIA